MGTQNPRFRLPVFGLDIGLGSEAGGFVWLQGSEWLLASQLSEAPVCKYHFATLLPLTACIPF